jgi:hypothetical protein
MMNKEVTNSNWIVDDLKQELVKAITDNTEISESGCQKVLTKIADSMILKHRSDAGSKKYQDSRSTLLKLYSGAMLALDGTRLDILFRVVNKDLPKWAQGKVFSARKRSGTVSPDIAKLSNGEVKRMAAKYADDVAFADVLILEGHTRTTKGSVAITITDK